MRVQTARRSGTVCGQFERVAWSGVTVSDALREIADGVWGSLVSLARPTGAGVGAASTELERLSAVYAQLHMEAAALARDDIRAAVEEGRRQGRRRFQQRLRKQGYDV